MRLSFEEKSKLAAMYERHRKRRLNGWNAMLCGLALPLVMCLHDMRKELHDPSGGKHLVAFCALGFLIGAAFAAVLFRGFFVARQGRRDAETLAFMEKHFPDECPWKEDETVLRRADELQRQGRADAILRGAKLSS